VGWFPVLPKAPLFQADDREVLRGFRRHHREDGGPKQAPVAVEDDNVLTRRDGEPEADRGRLGVTPDARIFETDRVASVVF